MSLADGMAWEKEHGPPPPPPALDTAGVEQLVMRCLQVTGRVEVVKEPGDFNDLVIRADGVQYTISVWRE